MCEKRTNSRKSWTKFTRESVEYRGVQFHRYPDSPKRHLRVYFWGFFNGRGTSLHQQVWRDVNGEIPDGFEIHHDDGNPLNNDVSNLKCVRHKEHLAEHASRGAFSTPEQLEHLQEIRPLSVAWHSSDEGLEWHRQHGLETGGKRLDYQLTCEHCGKEYVGHKGGRANYCSGKCKGRAHYRRRQTAHSLVCEWCKQPFTSDRKRTRFCSKSCCGFWRHEQKKVAGLPAKGF